MISSAHLSLFGSNAPLYLVFTERQSQPIPDSRRSPHDLRFVITSRRFHYGDRFDPSERAGIGQTRIGPKLAETLSALGHCRRCASDFDVGLVVLVAGHNGDGRVLQLSPSVDGRAPDWLCARAPLRRRISRGSRARYTLLACRRPAVRGAILPLRDRKSTRLNSSHGSISYAVFCLKKQSEQPKLTGPSEQTHARTRQAEDIEHTRGPAIDRKRTRLTRRNRRTSHACWCMRD